MGGVASPLMDLWIGSQARRLPDQEEIPILAENKWGNEERDAIHFFFREAQNNHRCPQISPLEPKQLLKILEKIVEIHEISYDWSSSINLEELIDSSGSSPLRTYIRALLESLDIKFLHSVDFKPTISFEKIDLVVDDEDFFQEDEGINN